jgi:sulfur transfer protein SufE
MTLRERQDEFIADMAMFDNWADRFDRLIQLSDELPVQFPEYLRAYRIESCQSKTCFKAYKEGDVIYTDGWSNSVIMGGIIAAIMKTFNRSQVREIQRTGIDFHIKSGLIDNLTPMRQAALMEIICRITVLLK